jgi:hypothetical protein
MTQMTRPRFLPDNFTLMLITVVIIASFLPATGQVAVGFGWLTNIAIALLFFLHGAKLSRESIIAGAGHWRLHLLVFGLTFVLFPLLGLALKPVLSPLIGKDLYMGILYLCALPATVQSAIAFTSLARGNIPAAICSAAASSLFGIFLTPLLVTLLLNVHGEGGSTLDAIVKISVHCGADHPPLDWRLGWTQQELAEICRSGIDFAGGLRRVQRGGERRHLAENASLGLGRAGIGVLPAADAGTGGVDPALQTVRFQPGRPHHHPFLRLKEKPGHRRAHGPSVVRWQYDRAADPAVDAVPPDSVDGVCGGRAAVCQADGAGGGVDGAG